jgi:hypothetical protein
VFEVGPLDAEDPDKAYWQTKSPQERMEALELRRHYLRLRFSYHPTSKSS